jgi:hypothetical protein
MRVGIGNLHGSGWSKTEVVQPLHRVDNLCLGTRVSLINHQYMRNPSPGCFDPKLLVLLAFFAKVRSASEMTTHVEDSRSLWLE